MFSDGTPMTADDVVFSLQRVIGIKGNPSFLLDGVTVTKKDDTTVVLTTATPNAGAAVHPAQPGARHRELQGGQANGGTTDEKRRRREVPQRRLRRVGPYVLKSLNLASQVVLTANTKYDGRQARLQPRRHPERGGRHPEDQRPGR